MHYTLMKLTEQRKKAKKKINGCIVIQQDWETINTYTVSTAKLECVRVLKDEYIQIVLCGAKLPSRPEQMLFFKSILHSVKTFHTKRRSGLKNSPTEMWVPSGVWSLPFMFLFYSSQCAFAHFQRSQHVGLTAAQQRHSVALHTDRPKENIFFLEKSIRWRYTDQ